MKRITIGNKEYTIEYSIEASLYDDCTKSIMDIFVKAGMSDHYAKTGDAHSALDEIVNTMTTLPQRVVTLFYAGLLEHHGNCGDHSVKSKSDAKEILKIYMRETGKSFSTVNTELMECIGDDNFFELTGLNDMLQTTQEIQTEEEEKPKKTRKKNAEDGKSSSGK
jgi:hypothetical protein